MGIVQPLSTRKENGSGYEQKFVNELAILSRYTGNFIPLRSCHYIYHENELWISKLNHHLI